MKMYASRALGLGALAAICASTSSSGASEGDIPSAIVITKSSNKNQVHYAVHVDERCAPIAPSPVSASWRMLERGPFAREALESKEERVLGIEHQHVEAGSVLVTLRAFPGRALTIHTWRGNDGRCASEVDTTVAGVPARLAGIFVQQKLFGISYILLTGLAAHGAVVRERLVP